MEKRGHHLGARAKNFAIVFTHIVLGFVIRVGGWQLACPFGRADPLTSPEKCATCFFRGQIPQLSRNFYVAEAALRNRSTRCGSESLCGDNTACELLSAMAARCPGKDIIQCAGAARVELFPQNTGFPFPDFWLFLAQSRYTYV